MQNTMTDKLEEVAKLRHEKPQEIIAEAVEIGLDKMWAGLILAQYLKKQISRQKAIQLVGFELVGLAEHQNKIVQADIKWGLNDRKNCR